MHPLSAVSDRPVPETCGLSCIALPKHGEFIAYSTNRTVMFWDPSTHTQLGLIKHPQHIRSVALLPDDRFLAIGGDCGKIIIKSLSRITDSIPLSGLHPTFQIDEAALDLWKHDQLENTEALLIAAITTSQNPRDYVLASRALVRARLRLWDAALVDAEMVPLSHKAYWACDITFECFRSSHVTCLLLIKAIIVSLAGEHRNAISTRMTSSLLSPSTHSAMSFRHAHYEGAIQSFFALLNVVRPCLSRGHCSLWNGRDQNET
ncbi:hypothetical protein OG21DRAFT_962817 [Imleria badia]|nr:hypothetical protein OG21DRAFT_962817 [Imleria badia]